MPALSGLMVAALGLLAALVVYFLAWRATAHRSIATQALVRGGLFVLLAVPLAAVFLLSPTMHRALDKREPQLSSPLDDEAPPTPTAKSDAKPRGRLGDPADGSSPPMATMAQESAWDVMPVFFGTDREEKPDPKRLAYSAERGRRLELGRAMVTVPKSHQVPNVERPWVIKIPYFDVTIYEQAEDPAQHFTMQEMKKLSQTDFVALVRERLTASNRYKDHALVFVHGYNTSFDNALYRTAQIAYDLKFDGAAFLYSWPSGGAVASYTYDRESAQASEPYMRAFLDLVIKQSGATSVSIIAHSMGNQPLMDVLKDMRNAAPEVAINEVILAAPDVDADSFANVAQRIEGIARGVTLYAAANDRALIVSRNFWQNPRAGDVTASGPLIVPGIETIDVTAASTDSFALNHSGYAENNELLQDIGKLILSGLRPPDQRLPALKRTSSPKGDYWRYTAP
jgi:esterase/lipase superfamily enzyme